MSRTRKLQQRLKRAAVVVTAALSMPGCAGFFGSAGPTSSTEVSEPESRARMVERSEPGLATTIQTGTALSAMIALGHAQEAYGAGRTTTARLRAEASRLNHLVEELSRRRGRHETLCAQASMLIAEVELQALEGPGELSGVESRAYRELVRNREEDAPSGDEDPSHLLAMATPSGDEEEDEIEDVVEETAEAAAAQDAHLDAALDAPSQARVLKRLDAATPAMARLEETLGEAEAEVVAEEGWTLEWPLESVRVTSKFGMRRDPIKRSKKKMHRGTDLSGAKGTPVFAAGPGEVLLAGWGGRGTGNAVVIRHPNGVVTQYFHLSKVSVRAGEVLRQGVKVGEVGATGRATGPHLHFQVSIEGEAVDPERWIGKTF